MAITYGDSWVEICNRALDRLGSELIEDLAEGSSNANHCSLLLGQAIEMVVGDYDWHSLRKRAQLAPAAETPVYGYTYKYLLPADMVTLIEIDNNDNDFSFEDNYVLTDSDELYITYVARPTEDMSKLPGKLKTAFQAQLTALLAAPLHMSEQSVLLFQREAADAVMKARTEDARRAKDTDGPTLRGFTYHEENR